MQKVLNNAPTLVAANNDNFDATLILVCSTFQKRKCTRREHLDMCMG